MFISSLKQKIACKIHDEHSAVKDMPPPNETLAKMAAKNAPSGNEGAACNSTLFYIPICNHFSMSQCSDTHSFKVTGGHAYPSAPGEDMIHVLTESHQFMNAWYVCCTHCTGVTLSSSTAAVQKQPSHEGIQRVVEEITARDKTV